MEKEAQESQRTATPARLHHVVRLQRPLARHVPRREDAAKETLLAFATDIVINDNAAAARTFSLRKTEGFNTERIDQATTQAEPRLMVIKHSMTGKKGSSSQTSRHLVSFQYTKKSSLGVLQNLVLNTTLSWPDDGTFVRADVDHLIAFLKNWIGVGANVDKLVRNES